jgi:TctA family transporter
MLADAGRPELARAIEQAAHRWYATDAGYPGGWEPSGHDFLSPALTEAELMTRLLPAGEFSGWLGAFLPGLAAGEPTALFTPAVVSDSSDGQIAHLHGLNLSRAWCWRRLAETLPAGDPRVPVCVAAARTHAEAALPHVVADDYMVTHWLAAYAVLLFS